jgi:murein DD-endopeptidase MepM/ murein hydrolase activator NlpD
MAQIQAEVTRLDNLGKKLVARSETEINASLSWDDIIAQEQSGSSKKRSVASRRFARQTPLAGKILPLPSTWLPSQPSLIAGNDNDSSEDLVEDMEGLRCLAPRQELPSGWPVKFGCISSKFGPRHRRMHKGIDIATSKGMEVLAVEGGIVTRSGRMRGYGNMVEIQHGGVYTTRYGHNTKNSVEVGEIVTKGQVIGYAGATGRATGVHVHFEIREMGAPINPSDYLASVNSVRSVKLTDEDIQQVSSRK